MYVHNIAIMHIMLHNVIIATLLLHPVSGWPQSHCWPIDHSNMIFEDNNITSTEPGILPHGNSVSFYDYQNVPSSANWSFSHNYLARPPNNDPHNWAFHETFTGDGSGKSSGINRVLSSSRAHNAKFRTEVQCKTVSNLL